MTRKFDDATLVAYIDGELDDTLAEEIALFLTQNSEARAFVEDLKVLDRQLQHDADEIAFAGGLDELKARLTTLAGTPQSRIRRRMDWGQAAPIAATVVALVVGLALGYLTANHRLDNQIAALASAREEDQKMLRTAISNALEKVASGHVVNWQSATTGAEARVRPIRTFKAKDGSWCREYERLLTFDTQTELTHAIACRKGEANWQTRVVTTDG